MKCKHMGERGGRVADTRQRILDCIARHLREQGRAPSLRQIADEVGLSSVATVHAHLERL